MDISISQQQGNVPVTVFHIRGDINASTYEDLLKQAEQSVQSGARDLVLDMSEVPYMSSAGIRALNAIFKLMRGDSPAESDEAMSKGLRDGSFKSPHLKLVNPNRNVHEVLKMAGLDMFLEIHRNLKDAVASY